MEPILGRKVEPLSCPFCEAASTEGAPGELFRIFRDGRSAWQVVCVLCGARGPSIPTADAGPSGLAVACIDAWNRRAPSPNERDLRGIISRLLADGPTPEITASIRAVEERVVKYRKETGR